MDRLQGKVAIITGAGRGIGAELVRAVIAEGGRVVAGVRDTESPAATRLRGLGEACVPTRLEVTDQGDWQAAVDLAVSTFGSLSVLVNNAGIVNFGAFPDYTVESWEQILAVNLTGTFLGIKTARDALVASAPASVINFSSATGISAIPELHGYVASKYGVRGLTRSAAIELAPFGVRVNCICPGTVATDMNKDLDVSDFNPMRRKGDAREVASLLVHLASDESTFTTGADYAVDGGELAGRVPRLEHLG